MNSGSRICCTALTLILAASPTPADKDDTRPNILFAIADDWGWPHAGAYGDEVVRTPTFDRLAGEGVLFEHAYVSSPSCTPSRNAILTGQYHWRLEEGANLWSTLHTKFPVYPLLLKTAGYHVGRWRKSWGPGNLAAGGYVDQHPAGDNYPKGFESFLAARPEGAPFCFWLGSSDPHRGYKKGSGAASGLDVDAIEVPAFYPDEPEIRSDIADYYFEVERFDSDVARALELLEEAGELENTIVVMTGDHGMPFPRCKSNLYDMGTRVPLAIRWGDEVKGGRKVTDFVSFVDLAPTFLEAGGVSVPEAMSGNSLMRLLKSQSSGRVEVARDRVVFGKERHVPAQESPSTGGYPCRGLRTDGYLYIRNFEPERWPAGVSENATHPMGHFADCDNGPTKQLLMENRESKFFELAFARRPAEELYDVARDPNQIDNLADDPEYADVKSRLAALLMAELEATADPRASGEAVPFDDYPYRARYELNR
jgi:N-sulfoglucosamine sulfohydrolase